ncbi:hypothetical protein ASG87_01650 [Frateuria sp. Soil773]|uniref:hypothetical protein n=1 Tax=Frateuria sp. Soil773 TaxID=1736407 RepID=UPI0006F48337|nr:hypothetical protein [Frateuria sp. Soil773]KRE90869.1 hypothetical protein ASG87_01650 [Frateuria sp. Soil773]
MKQLSIMASALVFAVCASTVHAQQSGVAGFFHRAGAALKTGASQVLGHPNAAGGGATTTGATFRPITPASGGQFQGLFDTWHSGDAWPRASVYFTRWGPSLPCWTARATIWRSARSSHVETFQVCNAPLYIKDDMGGSMQLSATHSASSVTVQMDTAQNIQGITHADTSNTRNAGPNPPHMLFALNFGAEGPALMPQYHEILLRVMYAAGFEDATTKGISNTGGKVLWVQGFDPAGKSN